MEVLGSIRGPGQPGMGWDLEPGSAGKAVGSVTRDRSLTRKFSLNRMENEMNRTRRAVLKGAAAAAALAGNASIVEAQAATGKKVHYQGAKPDKTPLFSGAVSFGNLLFIAGKGAHFPGDITAHTKFVLDELEKELV